MAGNFQQIGEQFVQQYYATFDSNRQGLVPMYNETSMLTFEGEQFQGAQGIVQKLASLPFQAVKHQVVKCDCQPSPPSSIMIFVTGSLFVDNNPQPLKFSEIFTLGQTAQGGWFCQNDIFRLNA
eukprot:TRINITY_DN800_c0_g2_i1.p2 TRINITY_DN800_c0_g2~~TRINITY_DN800_c0_g2_i1.p2  ORF type:complete len:124 (-),score=35.86 TRINITY_DN800_c0_g2_i1:145-516(-)